ncbi:hypothetical protein [Lysinibacillus xylanilyticus]|uniref:hypothetical protein n=1 Tax=Lysinibacillus xylanilyticus TaxID=582475 RepID=UPI003CFE1C90
MLSVRKRSDSNKCYLCESEATATNVICAKAKRQQQQYAKAKMIKSIRTSPLVRMRYMKIIYGYPYIHTFGGIYNGNS